jgi:DNA-binding CsgD family transcriptional regulator
VGDAVLVGRRDVVATIVDLLSERRAGVLLVGEAGLGKTTVLDAVVQTVVPTSRTVRVASYEVDRRTDLALATDLARALLDLGPATNPQTEAALVVLAEPSLDDVALDRRALGAALGRQLASAAATEPLLVVLDDLHWIDEASASVVGAAVRRAAPADVRVLGATRGASALELQGTVVIPLEPLPEAALRDLVAPHLTSQDRLLTRPLITAAGGNPMLALEIARALPARATVDHLRLPVPLFDRVRERLSALPVGTRTLLVDVAISSGCTWEDLDEPDGLVPALDGGLVVRTGATVTFAHPLYTRAVLDLATPGQLARAHGSAALRSSDPLDRARHLSHTVLEPDERTAADLEAAGHAFRRRGDVLSGQRVARAAYDATPTDTDRRVRWRRAALWAQALVDGDADASPALAALAMLTSTPDEHARLRLLESAAFVEMRIAAREVLDAPDISSSERLMAASQLLTAELFLGTHRAGVDRVRSWLPLVPPTDAEGEWARAVSDLALMMRLSGTRIDPRLLARAQRIESLPESVPASQGEVPDTVVGLLAMYDDDHVTADRYLSEVAELAPDVPSSEAFHALELWARRGEVRRARAFIEDGVGWYVDPGFSFVYALVAAWEGDEAELARVVDAGRPQSEHRGDLMYPLGIDTARALLELGRGNPEIAWSYAGPASRALHDRGWQEPSIFPVLPLAIEAALGTGRDTQAAELLQWLDQVAAHLPSRWAAAGALRARGIQAGVAGDTDRAVDLLGEAQSLYAELGLPNEQRRAQLMAGQILRRRGRRQAARLQLTQARDELSRMGIHGFAGLASAELLRLGGRRASGEELTEAERRVAELVSTGASNQDVAASLVVSVKTVESHLSRIYRKLDVRTRSELAATWRGLAP